MIEKQGKNTLIEILDKLDEKAFYTENSKEISFEERISSMEQRFRMMEENLNKKVLDFKMKRKEMRKSLQIIEKIDHQQNQSGDDLNLIWKTLNTIVVNSKVYFDDVRQELEKRIQDLKIEITGLLNFDDVKQIIDELKKNNIDSLLTEKKFSGMMEVVKMDIYGNVEKINEQKYNEIVNDNKKLNDLIQKEKFII